MAVPAPAIITCPQWGAKRPRVKPTLTGKPDKGLVHHTDGHHPELGGMGESVEEAIAYARALQDLHMRPPRSWNDSGHNFLIGRNGIILQGRWGTVTAIEHGRMIQSAHCPGQNGNPGVEFEHLPGESITAAQETSGIHLYAWIFDRCNISPTQLFGHRDFYNTQCPDALYPLIKNWRLSIAKVITHYGRGSARPSGRARATLAVRQELRRT